MFFDVDHFLFLLKNKNALNKDVINAVPPYFRVKSLHFAALTGSAGFPFPENTSQGVTTKSSDLFSPATELSTFPLGYHILFISLH